MDELKIFKQISLDKNELELDIREIKSIIEALLFTSGEPVSIAGISDVLDIDKPTIKKIIQEMTNDFNYERRGIQIINFDDKYQLGTRPEHNEYIRKLLKPQNKQYLSKAAVETIAIIAYKQPITRQTIDSIRGVKSDRIISNLFEKRLIKELGRMDTPGRPILYGTTEEFLKYFGLGNIQELPKLDDVDI